MSPSSVARSPFKREDDYWEIFSEAPRAFSEAERRLTRTIPMRTLSSWDPLLASLLGLAVGQVRWRSDDGGWEK